MTERTHQPSCGSVVYAGRYPSQPCDCRGYDDEDDWWADDAPEDCDHSEAELDWEGRYECSCGHSWWATAEEQDAYWQAIERANRPPTIRERISDRWTAFKEAVRRALRPRKAVALDDDIPF